MYTFTIDVMAWLSWGNALIIRGSKHRQPIPLLSGVPNSPQPRDVHLALAIHGPFATKVPCVPCCKVCFYPPHTPTDCPKPHSNSKSLCSTELATGSSVFTAVVPLPLH